METTGYKLIDRSDLEESALLLCIQEISKVIYFYKVFLYKAAKWWPCFSLRLKLQKRVKKLVFMKWIFFIYSGNLKLSFQWYTVYGQLIAFMSREMVEIYGHVFSQKHGHWISPVWPSDLDKG